MPTKQKAKQQKQPPKPRYATPEETKPDWTHACENCGARPVLPVTGMCGPCTFGEADTAGGNWE